MALHLPFEAMEDISLLTNDLLEQHVPVVFYINCDRLWSNLVNETVSAIPELVYRCKEGTVEERVHSICLI